MKCNIADKTQRNTIKQDFEGQAINNIKTNAMNFAAIV